MIAKNGIVQDEEEHPEDYKPGKSGKQTERPGKGQ